MKHNDNVTHVWNNVALVATLVFGQWPGIDLWVAAQFHDPVAAFWLAENGAVTLLRSVMWDTSRLVCLVGLVGLVTSLTLQRTALWLPARIWGFVLALYAVGPGLVVNLGLKAHWGRARPDQVAEFGGGRIFTPPLQMAHECSRNCSFVSGEAAAAAALGICLFVVLRHLRPRLDPAVFRIGVGAAAVLVFVGGLLRIVAGRHFLSDVVFAWLIVAGIALVLDWLLLREGWRRLAVPIVALTEKHLR